MSRKTTDARSSRRGIARLWFRDQLLVVLVAIVFALGARALVIEPFQIPSDSMLPTLQAGDHIFVSKWVYGAALPFGVRYRLPAMREPRRGEVVVFTLGQQGSEIFPRDERPDLPARRFVKRIIGLPGDRVASRDGVLFINGERVAAAPVGEIFWDEQGRRLEGWQETLDTGVHWLARGSNLLREDFVWEVPPGRYFVMGDHRDYSLDSRQIGTVPRDDLIGPVWMVYWSWGPSVQGAAPAAMTGELWTRFRQIRWERVGERVQ